MNKVFGIAKGDNQNAVKNIYDSFNKILWNDVANKGTLLKR